MKIIVECNTKEIADLLLRIKSQPDEKLILKKIAEKFKAYSAHEVSDIL